MFRKSFVVIASAMLSAAVASPVAAQVVQPASPATYPALTAPASVTVGTSGAVGGVSVSTNDFPQISVAIKVTGGTLAFPTTGTTAAPYWDGTGGKWKQISGSRANINALLAGLQFTPTTPGGSGSIDLKTTGWSPYSGMWNPGNDHFYTRDAAAFARTYEGVRTHINSDYFDYDGLNGYLATVTTPSEADFLDAWIPSGEGFVSGSDTAAEGTWRYTDGPESGQAFYAAGASTGGFYNGFASAPTTNTSANYLSMEGKTFSAAANSTTTQNYWVEFGGTAGDADRVSEATVAINPTSGGGTTPTTPIEAPKALTGAGSATVDPATGTLKILPKATTPNPVAEKVAPTLSGNGSWVVNPDGGVFTAGDAQFFGSMGAKRLNQPMVSITGTDTGKGYWTVARDGGVFSFGDAQFHGSTGALTLNQPITQLTQTCEKAGYYLTAEDGGVFAFGDAQFHGSMGGKPLNKGITGLVDSCGKNGYYLFAADGGVFAFGDAPFYGSLGDRKIDGSVTGMVLKPNGVGYWLIVQNGNTSTAYSFGPGAAV